MSKFYQILQQTTITGLILFFLGIITFIPEIYFSGILVMIVSSALHVHQMEAMRVENQSVVTDSALQGSSEAYYSW